MCCTQLLIYNDSLAAVQRDNECCLISVADDLRTSFTVPHNTQMAVLLVFHELYEAELS